ncbi:MAG: hypothetical protein FWE07_02700 [Turicibacter sp.]|nr:hypothetical protein [Turicibacter sp.]
MKNIKLFGLLIFTAFALMACDSEPGERNNDAAEADALVDELIAPVATDFENEMAYFEAQIDYFEIAVEALEAAFAEIDSEGEALNVIQAEGLILSERIENSMNELGVYLWENFEEHCIEDGGVYIYEAFYDIRQCSFRPDVTPEREDREHIQFMYMELFMRLVAIEYAFFGDNLTDFENRLDELDVLVDELVITLDELLTSEPTISEGDERLVAIADQANTLGNHVHAVRLGIMRYTSANPEIYPVDCVDPNYYYTVYCPQRELITIRISEMMWELMRVRLPFGAG